MKVLIICSQYPPMASPEGKHAFMLCENLARHGAEVHLLTSTLGDNSPPPRGFSLHPEITAWSWSGARQLIRAVKRIQPDAIMLMYVSWIYLDHPMITFAPSFLRRAGAGHAFITLVENTFGSPSISTLNQKIRWQVAALLSGVHKPEVKYGSLLEKSDAIIALTQHHLDTLVTACPAVNAKARIIPAPALLRLRPEEGGKARAEGRALLGLDPDDQATFVLVFFGFVYPGKGVETLLHALSLLRKRGLQKFKLLVIGKVGPQLEASLKKIEAELEVADVVVWLGHTPDEATSTYLWASDAAVLPFDDGIRLNNSSFAVCAMHGLPIITTRGENMEPLFQHLENAVLCPPKNAGAIVNAIEQLMLSPPLRRNLRHGALALAQAVFSWDAIVPPLLAFLESTVKRVRTAGAA